MRNNFNVEGGVKAGRQAGKQAVSQAGNQSNAISTWKPRLAITNLAHSYRSLSQLPGILIKVQALAKGNQFAIVNPYLAGHILL